MRISDWSSDVCSSDLLVEWMIRIAAGETLSFGQKDVKLDGWAVETRVYAEDPLRDFMPSIGRLVRYLPPASPEDEAITVRIDSGVALMAIAVGFVFGSSRMWQIGRAHV